MSLLEFFQEDNGGLSATRLAFLLWATGVLVVWIISSLTNGKLQPIDSSVTTILGILMVGKVVQKFGEKPGQPSPPVNVGNP
jgi:hypothetical protein